jgi:hypothetical protein
MRAIWVALKPELLLMPGSLGRKSKPSAAEDFADQLCFQTDSSLAESV